MEEGRGKKASIITSVFAFSSKRREGAAGRERGALLTNFFIFLKKKQLSCGRFTVIRNTVTLKCQRARASSCSRCIHFHLSAQSLQPVPLFVGTFPPLPLAVVSISIGPLDLERALVAWKTHARM
jgi:hypothetical protein